MRVRTVYSGTDRSYDFPDERWPHADLVEQARIAIGLWVADPHQRWGGSIGGNGVVKRPDGMLYADVGGREFFRFQPSDIGGPW